MIHHNEAQRAPHGLSTKSSISAGMGTYALFLTLSHSENLFSAQITDSLALADSGRFPKC